MLVDLKWCWTLCFLGCLFWRELQSVANEVSWQQGQAGRKIEISLYGTEAWGGGGIEDRWWEGQPLNDLNVTEHERHIFNVCISQIFFFFSHFSHLDVGVHFLFWKKTHLNLNGFISRWSVFFFFFLYAKMFGLRKHFDSATRRPPALGLLKEWVCGWKPATKQKTWPFTLT